MDVLRTPDERFSSLSGFDHPVSYADVPDGDGGTLRMAYVDAGPADGPVVLLLHGEPSWSYLYRDVIAVLVAHGLRAVVPDLVGFGRSDKPARRPTTPTPGTWSGCARSASTCSTCTTSRWSGRTGAA